MYEGVQRQWYTARRGRSFGPPRSSGATQNRYKHLPSGVPFKHHEPFIHTTLGEGGGKHLLRILK